MGERHGFVAQVYSTDAATYDEEWSPVIRPAGEALIQELPLTRVRRVVDVGAGSGALTDAIRRAAPTAAVVGVDAAEGMLRIAQARRNLPGIVAEAGRLPVGDQSVDAVVLAFVLFHLTDPLAGLREATRILRPGGHVGTVTWAEEQPAPASRAWEVALDDAGAPAAPPRSDNRGLDSIESVEELLVRAGLRPVHAFTEAIDHTFSNEQFWRLRVGFGSPRWRLSQLEPAVRAALLDELRRQVDGFGPEQLRFRGRVVLAIAERP